MGGRFSGFQRMVAGESFFIATFRRNASGEGHLEFASPDPGPIIPRRAKKSDWGGWG